MPRIIPRPMHAVLDYLWGAAHTAAPQLFGYENNKAAVAFSQFRGGSAIAASLLTRYELGLIRVLPFKVHLMGDFAGALLGLAAPWLFGFDKDEKARNAVLGFAIAELGVVMMSRTDEM